MFELSEDTKASVRTKELALSTKQEELRRTTRKVTASETTTQRMWDKMNFRERYLGGWFGGDKQKVKDYKAAIELQEQFESAASDIAHEINVIDESLVRTLDEELRVYDISYQQLLVPLEAAQTLKTAIDRFLKEIDEALKEVDDADTMETFDLVSSNVGISVISYLENQEAAEEIDDVKEALPAFQKALKDYDDKINAIDLSDFSAAINDGWDLAFDFAFDGFDFMSIFTLAALDEAETQLEDVRSKVEDVERMANKHIEQAQGNVSTYINKARLSCR